MGTSGCNEFCCNVVRMILVLTTELTVMVRFIPTIRREKREREKERQTDRDKDKEERWKIERVRMRG